MNRKSLLLTVIAIIGFIALTSAQVPGNVPTNGLLTWYAFNGNGDDISGNLNNATNNGATFVVDRFGIINAAAYLNGTSNYLIVNAPGFTFNENGPFTASIWLNKQSPTASGVAIMSGNSTAGNFIWNLQGKSNMQYGTNMQMSSWTWTTCPHTLNVWDHYVVTYDMKIMNLYRNGVFQSTATYPYTGAASSTLPFFIGKGPAGNNYRGELDDIGIWDRVLTQSEITTLYMSCNMSIVGQPTDQNHKVGENASFNCTASPYPSSFQWQSDDGSGFQDLSNTGQYSGATSDNLTVWVLSMANDQQAFRCIVGLGTCVDTSDIAYINICGEITTQPADLTVNVNDDAQFTIVSSDPAAVFQWQLYNAGVYQDLSNTGQYNGANDDTLNISNTTMTNNGEYYRCMVTSGACTDSSHTAQLTVDNNVGVPESTKQMGFSVYPNPANDHIIVKIDPSLIGSQYAILDQLGKVLIKEKLTIEQSKVDISNLARGVYFIKIGENSEHTLKLLKK